MLGDCPLSQGNNRSAKPYETLQWNPAVGYGRVACDLHRPQVAREPGYEEPLVYIPFSSRSLVQGQSVALM